MSFFKDAILKQGFKWLSDPRVMKLMQDERVTRAIMAAVSLPAKAQSFAREQLESAARAMSLATEDEIRDLQRTVRKLEDDLAELRTGASAGRDATREHAVLSSDSLLKPMSHE